jgi:hypothetical protein
LESAIAVGWTSSALDAGSVLKLTVLEQPAAHRSAANLKMVEYLFIQDCNQF